MKKERKETRGRQMRKEREKIRERGERKLGGEGGKVKGREERENECHTDGWDRTRRVKYCLNIGDLNLFAAARTS